VIAFMNHEHRRPDHQRARNALAIARMRLLEAEEWLMKQSDAEIPWELSQDYGKVAKREIRAALRMAGEVDMGL